MDTVRIKSVNQISRGLIDQRKRYTHGLRVALTSILDNETLDSHQRTRLKVLDFGWHSRAIHVDRRFDQLSSHPGRTPTVIERGVVFENRVVTSLPYFVCERTIDARYEGFLMDDQRIVAVTVRHHLIPRLFATSPHDEVRIHLSPISTTLLYSRFELLALNTDTILRLIYILPRLHPSA